MFDSIHTGTRCGQVKCFYRTLSDLNDGSPVVLKHPPSDGATYEAMLRGEDMSHLDDERQDYQIAMNEGGWVLVRGGTITAWVEERATDLDQLDTRGEPYDPSTHRSWESRIDECAVCAELRGDPPPPSAFGDMGESEWRLLLSDLDR